MSQKSDLLLHPIRMRLVTELAGRQMTTRQLADALPDIPQATLYRQIKRLHDGGIFEVVTEQLVNGATERTYAVTDGGARLTPAEVADLSPEAHIRHFTTFTAGLIDTFTRFIEQTPAAGTGLEAMSYNRATIYLSTEEKAEFQEKIVALVQSVMSQPPTPERQRYTLASIVIPEEQKGSS